MEKAGKGYRRAGKALKHGGRGVWGKGFGGGEEGGVVTSSSR